MAMTTGKGKTILVAGGAGFLGTNLCDQLFHAGHHVICLGNFQTGRWLNLHRFSLVSIDIINHDLAENLPADLDVDDLKDTLLLADSNAESLAPRACNIRRKPHSNLSLHEPLQAGDLRLPEQLDRAYGRELR
jgi:NAD(P)-dependent dehydrogenase (short-subunit alcohol dehydrogenase family)